MARTEVELIEQTLELLAEAIDDITPQVYDNFFALRPEAAELFDADSQMNRGQMLNEVFTCLTEQAAAKGYLDDVFQAHIADHAGMGVADMGMYQDFLSALRSTVAEVLGGDWPQDARVVFEQHCDLMNRKLLAAEQALTGQKMLHLESLKLRKVTKSDT